MTAPTTDLQQVAEFIAQFVSNPGLALQFAQDPNGTLVAQGLDQVDLESVDMNEAMLQACQTPGFPPDAATAIQSYVSGGGGGGGGGYTAPPPPAHGPAPVEHVVQQLQYVNYVTHEGDTTIQQTIIDQSTSVNVGDNFTGNIDFEVDNAAATGPGSVAGGEGDVNAATGVGSQVIDDSIGRPEPEQLRRFRAGRRGQQRPDRARPQLRRDQRRRHRRPGPGRQHQHRHHQRRHDRRAGPVQQHQHRRGRRRQRPGHRGRQRERDREHRRRQQRAASASDPAPSPPSATRR